jgi:hypothetical protein
LLPKHEHCPAVHARALSHARSHPPQSVGLETIPVSQAAAESSASLPLQLAVAAVQALTTHASDVATWLPLHV